MLKQPLLVICGPTAGGKTALAVQLALRLGGEVVSADSMQVYRGMDIGTAKPTAAETRGVPHHLIDILEPGEDFSVARYVELAGEAIRGIAEGGGLPILCGGTGLYIDSLTENIRFPEMPENPSLRSRLREQAQMEGGESLWRRLHGCDPVLAEKLAPSDLGRIIRGIEAYEATGVPMSEWQRRSRLEPSPYHACVIGLNFRERQTLYHRIDRRVDLMMEQGLLEEAKALYENGLGGTAGQAIGYKELFAFLRGETTLEEAVELLKRGTRRYAKRQLTWLRRNQAIHWLYPDDYGSGEELILAAEAVARQHLVLDGVEHGQNN